MTIYIYFKDKKREPLAYGSIGEIKEFNASIIFTDYEGKHKEFRMAEIDLVEVES